MLNIQKLTKRFGGRGGKAALQGVSLNVKAGEVYALIGPNGSGKTTLVKVVAGLLQPTGGTVTVDGRDVTADPVQTKQVTGYVPDEPAAWPGVTGEEFLHFIGALYGVPPADRARRIATLLRTFGLEGIERGTFEDFSRGNKQKFSIIASLLHQPQLLLIDEPIVGLDPRSARIAKEQFVRFAKGANGSGRAVLLVTHTLPVAEEIAARIGLLRNGRLAAEGTLAELRRKARLPKTASLEDVYTALT